ncbi:hypothetical protein GCM10007979_52700 [Nocardioides albus]|nr:hypothetical protein GCM10007979_52700 [Nocardioides albus]
MDTATLSLLIGSFAALVALGDVAFSAYSWRRGGARLDVRATSLVTTDFLLGTELFVAIEATNSGRTPTTVSGFGYLPRSGGVLLITESAVGIDRLPKRLDPGESAMYATRPSELREAAAKQGADPMTCVPYANCGHGRFKGKIDDKARALIANESL